MSPIQFKLVQTGPGALIRRVTFAEQPTWFALASRIESLYGIPLQDVGVSYADTDGDVITLSTHEELLDYYATVPRVNNNAIRFTVKNLGAQRAQQRNQPQQPTAGVHLFDLEEADWHIAGIPVFPRSENPPPPPPKSPSSAFVETVDSNASPEAPEVPQYRSVTSSPVSVQAEKANDNKDNLSDANDLYEGSDPSDGSSVSVLHDDTPNKQPVHVYASYRGRSRSRSRSRSPALPPLMRSSRSRSTSRSYSRSRSVSPIVVMTPPRCIIHSPSVLSQPSSPHPRVSADPPSPILGNLPAPDPPLPAGATSPPRPITPLPSLTKDVADLLSSLTNAFGSHPELSEGLKNIVRNASLGAYWAAERDTMVNNAIRAAESAQDGIARAAEQAQEEAGRKVTEALDGVFRALGGILSSSSQSQGTEEVHTGQPATHGERPRRRRTARSHSPMVNRISRPCSPSPERPPDIVLDGPRPRTPSWERPANRPSLVSPVATPPPIDSQTRDHRPLPGPFPYPFDYRTRPLPHRHWFPNPPPPGPAHVRYAYPAPPVPPPPPPGPAHARYNYPGPAPPPPSSSSPQYGRHFDVFAHSRYPPNYSPPWGGPYPPPPPPPPGPQNGLRRSSTLPGGFGPPRNGGPRNGLNLPPGYSMTHILPPPPSGIVASSSSARKAQLEEAKRYYKEKKEEWRREKEVKRKEKEKREAQRSMRMRHREREMRGGMIRQVSDVEEEARPVPPHPADLVNASSSQGPLVGTTDSNQKTREAARREQVLARLAVMGFTPQTHSQLENHVNKHLRSLPPWGSFDIEEIIEGLMTIYGPPPAAQPPVPLHPQGFETVDYTNQRSEASRSQQVFTRLAAMGFTYKTHPQLEVLVAKHLRKQSGRPNFNAEEVISGLMEDLFHPQGVTSGSGTRLEERARPEERRAGPSVPIPGAWNM